MSGHLSQRTDRNGTEIVKGDKKHVVSFADQIEKDKSRLADVYLVESYKKYNSDNTYGNHGCCNIV